MLSIANCRIEWKGIEIGQHAFLNLSYAGNTKEVIIPRAKGIYIWSTSQLGGGRLSVSIQSAVAFENRTTLEAYFTGLDSSMDLTTPGDIVIQDENGTVTLEDCYLASFAMGSDDLKINKFNMEFIKSL